jgi:hypothetical protein
VVRLPGRKRKCERCVGEGRCIIKKAEGCWAATVRSGCQAAIVQKSGDWLEPGEAPVVVVGSEVGGRRAKNGVEVRGIKDEETERERESGAVHTASTWC